jgi:hypothetical protein
MRKLLLCLLLIGSAHAQTYQNLYSPWMPWDARIKYTGTMSLLDASGVEVNKTALNSLFDNVTVVFPLQFVGATVPKVRVSLTITGTNDKGIVDLLGTTAFDYTLPTVYAAVAGSNPTFVYTPRSFNPTLVASAPIPVVVPPPDTIPPTVSITAPLAGATVVGTNPLTASAADNVGVAGVQFLIDGANFSAEITAPPYTTVWNSTTVADGAHTVAATARDAAGNRATSVPVAVKVSNAPPPPPPPPGISPDGTSITPTPAGQVLTTAGGKWTFGTATTGSGTQIFLNGTPAADGFGIRILLKGGLIYHTNNSAAWYKWTGTGWTQGAAP